MKCVQFDELSSRCQRCTLGRYDCTFTESLRGRSKKKLVSKVGERLSRLESSLDSFARTITVQTPALMAATPFQKPSQALRPSPSLDAVQLPSFVRSFIASSALPMAASSSSEHGRGQPRALDEGPQASSGPEGFAQTLEHRLWESTNILLSVPLKDQIYSRLYLKRTSRGSPQVGLRRTRSVRTVSIPDTQGSRFFIRVSVATANRRAAKYTCPAPGQGHKRFGSRCAFRDVRLISSGSCTKHADIVH